MLPRANLLASFNTQPPEGGWTSNTLTKIVIQRFNTQPPEGGWSCFAVEVVSSLLFQHTAARRRLVYIFNHHGHFAEFQHTAARRRLGRDAASLKHHDRFNTQPPEGGWGSLVYAQGYFYEFQHTAARRRLGVKSLLASLTRSFNTQPPEGGWYRYAYLCGAVCKVSTHSRPKAAGAWVSRKH